MDQMMTNEVVATEVMTKKEYTQEIIQEASRVVPQDAESVTIGSIGMDRIREYLSEK